MASNPIDCITKHAKHLSTDVNISREAATDLALKEFEKLHGELENFKKSINPKYKPQPYVSPDKSEAIKKITDDYQKQIDEANTPISEPVKAPVTKPEGKSDVVVDKASNVGAAAVKPKEGHVYRAIDNADDAVGNDKSFSNKTNWYDGEGFLIEAKNAEGKNIEHHEGAKRGNIKAEDVTTVYYEPDGIATDTKTVERELVKMKDKFPNAKFIEVESIEDKNGENQLHVKAVEQSLKETTKVETPTTNTGVEEGSGVGGDVKALSNTDRKILESNNFKDVDGMMMNMEGTRAWSKLSDSTKKLLKKYGIHYIEGYVNFDHLKGGETSHGNFVKLKNGEANGIQVNVSSVGDKFNIEKTILHELGHKVYEGLSSEQKKQLERDPITQHGKEVKKNVEDGGKTYKKEDIGEEDFAELFAEKKGDLKAVEQSLSKQESGGKAPVTKSEGAKVVMPGENVKPNIVELKKEEKYGKYETLARKAAENIMKAELPSWAKADLPDGTKLSGTNFDQIKKLIADATIKLGKLMDTGSEYAEAIKEAVKELVDYLGENRREDIEKGVTDAYLESGGELPKPKARITADQAEKLDAQSKKEKSQSDAYEAAGEFEFGRMPFEPTDNPIINHKLKTNGVQQAFGTELTQQELWNDMPSEEKYDVQIKMLDDGNEMIGLAKMMFGGTDINVYGPELFRFIQNMPDTPDNKKVILTASFIGELRNELDRSKSGSIRPLYNAVNLYYRNYMHVTAKRLAAGRILRLFTDKYMAGIFGDVILEADQVKEKKDIENAIADTDITDQDAASFQEAKSKGKTKEQAKKESDVDKKNNESKRSESAKRKAANKKNYEDLAKKKEADIKAKYGDKKSLLNDIIKKINDLNCP